MTVYVDVAPTLLEWAVERAGWDEETALRKFPHLTEWRAGTRRPTVKQLEKFAHATHAPFGQLFLLAPPEEPLPVPDMRTLCDAAIGRPSADLLDTIYLCQMRQDWFRDFALENSMDQVSYFGSATVSDAPANIAQSMREVLGVNPEDGPLAPSWGTAFSLLSDRVEASGTLVMVNGVVGANTHRVLRPEEFRGFTLADDLAPLVFVNGADSKAAQIFTLLHEFAHVWLGGSALSDVVLGAKSAPPDERWCNAVAAEFLTPREAVRSEYSGDDSAEGLDVLARRFTVSTLVVLRRLVDLSLITQDRYRERYEEENARVLALLSEAKDERTGGGSFYNVQPRRLSKQFTRAVIASAREGGTSYRQAYKLLGTKKHSTFEQLAERVGIS